MKLNLFGKEIDIHDHHCNFNDVSGQKIKEPYVNLYVRLTNSCQAKCKFCEFHSKDMNIFDPFKFLFTFYKLSRQVRINKVSFTGGEPTKEVKNLNCILKEIKDINKDFFTIVNTNGYRFKEINPEFVDSFALSRHSTEDDDNYEIFETENIPSWKDIATFESKEKLHLSCNLIKGYVDSSKKCSEYINFFGKLGITDIGFVSLMSVNEYSQVKKIDFDDINLGSMPNTVRSQNWSQKCGDKPTCKCANFLTYTDNGNIIKSYARYYVDRTECKSMLVYEPDGRLTAGFGGTVINDQSF